LRRRAAARKASTSAFLEWTVTSLPSFLPTIEGSRVGTNLRGVTHTSMRTFGADVLLGLVLAVLPGESVTGLGGEMEWGVRREQQIGEVYPVRLTLAYIYLYQASVHTAHQAATHVELHVHLQCSRRTCSSSSRACHMSSAASSWVARAGPAVVARCALCDNNDGGTNRNSKDIIVLAVSPPTRLLTANHRDRNRIVVAAAVPREPADS
jgi:hypothetical protein